MEFVLRFVPPHLERGLNVSENLKSILDFVDTFDSSFPSTVMLLIVFSIHVYSLSPNLDVH